MALTLRGPEGTHHGAAGEALSALRSHRETASKFWGRMPRPPSPTHAGLYFFKGNFFKGAAQVMYALCYLPRGSRLSLLE